jgi:L-seryl-tRNA(Ser) seleniumtransferase
MKEWLRSIPAVHEIKATHQFRTILDNSGLDEIEFTNQLRAILDMVRVQILQGNWNGSNPASGPFLDEIFTLLGEELNKNFQFTLKRVINATGTILHTNLGRSRLSQTAIDHVVDIARNYSNLEYKLDIGERGSRHTHVESLVKVLTGAEAAMVVNNNAAAVYLILRALANTKEVIVSRGQLVEIGGSFRISSIMEESGAKLVEVGTTNKTHLYDYERAINENTKMILKVHTSNFKTIGFTKTVETEELAQLASLHDHVIFYEDLGSGVLYDFNQHGIGEEPVVRKVIDMGADIVSFSGDKLLGGPQAGIIAGKKELIDVLRKHQLARVLRVDKMTLAGLEGTLLDYLKGETGRKNIPVFRDMLLSKNEIHQKANEMKSRLNRLAPQYTVVLRDDFSQVGGGTMPEVQLPTVLLALKHEKYTASAIAKKLRTEYKPAIVTRIQNDEVLLDLRTVEEDEVDLMIKALSEIL